MHALYLIVPYHRIATNRKPLPKVDQQMPGVNDLDLQQQEIRMMEKVRIFLTFNYISFCFA